MMSKYQHIYCTEYVCWSVRSVVLTTLFALRRQAAVWAQTAASLRWVNPGCNRPHAETIAKSDLMLRIRLICINIFLTEMFNLLDGQVTRTPPKTLASMSLCPYLGKWNQHRYEKNQQQEQQQKRKANLTLCFSDLELNALSFEFWVLQVLISLCNHPAGVVQVASTPGVGRGRAHHLRCHQTRSGNVLSQPATELRGPLPPCPPSLLLFPSEALPPCPVCFSWLLPGDFFFFFFCTSAIRNPVCMRKLRGAAFVHRLWRTLSLFCWKCCEMSARIFLSAVNERLTVFEDEYH